MKDIFDRLKQDYFEKVASVLKGQADVASIFPNKTDIGNSREQIYAEFLKSHLPSICNVNFGGFLFNYNGNESKQIDLIITTNVIPQFNFFNKNGEGKTFSPVEGTAAVVSIKSNLDKTNLFNAIENIASIPFPKEGRRKFSPHFKFPPEEEIDDYLLYKIIYANEGIAGKKILDYLNQYISQKNIVFPRIPNLVYVPGKYAIIKATTMPLIGDDGKKAEIGEYAIYYDEPDIIGLLHSILGIHESSYCFNHIIVVHSDLLNEIIERKHRTKPR